MGRGVVFVTSSRVSARRGRVGGGVVSRMRVDRCRLWGGTRRDAAGRGGTRLGDGSFVRLQDVFHPGHVARVVFAIFHQREGDVRDGHGE